MIVQITDKWIWAIAVPNCGIIRKPFNSDVVDVSTPAGNWLIEAGFAVMAKEELEIEQPPESDIKVPDSSGKPIEPFKSKKASKLFVNPEN